MNYYNRHIGDYAKDTAHLSFAEDGAYGRMLDMYYDGEAPLPLDMDALCRKLRARTRPDRDMIDRILNEFFRKAADGWHKKRCDEEIAKAREAGEDNAAKQENEKERQRRYRQRRKEIFAELREHGVVPKWDTSIDGLETELSRVRKQTLNGPVTRTATANQEPIANSQYPIAKEEQAAVPQEDRPRASLAGAMAAELRRLKVDIQSQNPVLLQWIADGITIPQLVESVCIARLRKPEPEPIPAAYLDRIVRDPPKQREDPWWQSEQATIAKGREFGVEAKAGETMESFRDRIKAAIAGKRRAA